jgi:hypothetical protein
MRISLAIGVVVVGVLAAGCSHDQLGNTSPIASTTASLSKGPVHTAGLVNQPVHTSGVTWSVPLGTDLSASKQMGPAGGWLSIPHAGAALFVPQGALADTVTITMSVHNGKVVAYDFAPHGLTFQRPLIFYQRLSNTRFSPSQASLLSLGYYPDAATVTDTGADVTESHGGWFNRADDSFTSWIGHFSGYMVATGRSVSAGE